MFPFSAASVVSFSQNEANAVEVLNVITVLNVIKS